MVPTTVITLLCLWACPTPNFIDINVNQWDTHRAPPAIIQTLEAVPTTLAPQANRGMGDDTEQWRPLIVGHFEPEDIERVLCLMELESGGNPTARNPSGARGLMQIMPFWPKRYGLAYEDLDKPEVNLYLARIIRDSQGWTAWSPYLRGLCH